MVKLIKKELHNINLNAVKPVHENHENFNYLPLYQYRPRRIFDARPMTASEADAQGLYNREFYGDTYEEKNLNDIKGFQIIKEHTPELYKNVSIPEWLPEEQFKKLFTTFYHSGFALRDKFKQEDDELKEKLQYLENRIKRNLYFDGTNIANLPDFIKKSMQKQIDALIEYKKAVEDSIVYLVIVHKDNEN